MTLNPEPPSDQELQRLLPFYVNQSLDQEEQSWVENYLNRSEGARHEVAYLAKLREKVKQQSAGSSPGKLGLLRLQRDIALRQDLQQNADTRAGQQARTHAREAQLSARGQGTTDWWRPVAIAACLMLAVTVSLSLDTWLQTDDHAQLAGTARTADLQVTFKPQASEAAIRALLLQHGLSIVEGPSSLGVYHLEADSKDEDKINSVLQELRMRVDVVDTADLE